MPEYRFFNKKVNIEILILFLFFFLKLLISFFPVEYGIFRDEFYYLAMSEHLDFGYLDVPPLAPFFLAVVRFFLNVSYFSLHLLPAISGCLILYLAYLIVKKLNGGIFAVIMVLTCITFAPQNIAFSTIYSYDYLDLLAWNLVIFILILLLNTNDKKYWIYFGLAAGFGLLAKITILYLGLGIFLALLVTKNRKYFLTWQFWVGGLTALLIFLPYIIWHISKDMIVLEYYKNYAAGKAAGTNPADFLLNHILSLNPLSLPLWVLGIYYFLFNKDGKKYNLISLVFIFVSTLSLLTRTKYYLVSPLFPVLFAGGAVAIEKFVVNSKKYVRWIALSYFVMLFLTGVFILPMARPVLSIDNYIKYSNLLKLDKQLKVENIATAILPQFYADRFGWQELTLKIKNAYDSLSNEEKKKCAIIVENYGEAGAIEYYGKKYGLPKPVCGHLQYFIWGDRGYTGEISIILGKNESELLDFFDSVTLTDKTYNKFAMPYENNKPVYLCRGAKIPLKKVFNELRNFN